MLFCSTSFLYRYDEMLNKWMWDHSLVHLFLSRSSVCLVKSIHNEKWSVHIQKSLGKVLKKT